VFDCRIAGVAVDLGAFAAVGRAGRAGETALPRRWVDVVTWARVGGMFHVSWFVQTEPVRAARGRGVGSTLV
jgi:hypothetical protein